MKEYFGVPVVIRDDVPRDTLLLVGQGKIVYHHVPSGTQGEIEYRIGTNTETGEKYCTCKGYRFRRKCKHLDV